MTHSASFTLRPVIGSDDAFLFQLYASTRIDELAPLGWSTAQREAFLRSQFTAQRTHYRATFPEAKHAVVVQGKRAIGALLVSHAADEIRLIDLSLLPEYRGAGIGTRLLRDLIEEARTANRPLRLHVLKNNPAARLYVRLGFTPVGENGLYLKMECRPA